MFETLPPAFIMFAGAVLIGVSRAATRSAIVLLTPLVALYAVWLVPDGASVSLPFLTYDIEVVEGGALRRLFATVFCIMAFAGGLFALRQARWYELSAAFAYAGGAIGVAFAGDLIALFLFWEMMALFSALLIWCGHTERSRAAGIRYIAMHLLGGILLKVGIEGWYGHAGSLEMQPLPLDNIGAWLILVGILINAAAPPVSAWLADAYPEASPSGAVLLSAFTTKTAVLALILLFPGAEVLIWVGLYMVFYGIIYAALENDMRRILAYSIVNQVGFMVCAVGIGTDMALNGAAAHAFAHILYMPLLLMSAGSVLYMTGRRKCSDLGGLFRSMPLTCICGIIGALSISAFPLTSGFVTNSMIAGAAGEGNLAVVWFMLMAASAGVFLHAGLKFPWFVFFQNDSGLRPPDPPWNMRAAMVFLSILCIGIGVLPGPLYQLLPFDAEYVPYNGGHLVAYSQLLLFSGLGFFSLLPLMKQTETISLDWDWFWRRGGLAFLRWATRQWNAGFAALEGGLRGGARAAIGSVYALTGPDSAIGRHLRTGSAVLFATTILGVILVLVLVIPELNG